MIAFAYIIISYVGSIFLSILSPTSPNVVAPQCGSKTMPLRLQVSCMAITAIPQKGIVLGCSACGASPLADGYLLYGALAMITN